MADQALAFAPASELARRIRDGELSPVTVVDAHLDRIAARNDHTNAYVTVAEDRAREHAREAERALESGEAVGPLCGVPVAIKDLQHVAGVRTTYGSPFYSDHVPEESHRFVTRLEAAGAIVLGKTNTPEFGYKSSTDNPAFGATSTPFDTDHTSGGSSGGSAAAVADGLAAFAQGSDGGGSIRIPASCCGVYGLKPSFGRVPYEDRPDGYGHHTPFTFLGPLARTVEDAALALDVMAGPDPVDPFSLPESDVDYRAVTDRGIGDLSVAYSADLGLFPIDPAVRETVDDAVGAFADAGASVDAVDFTAETGFDRTREAFRETFTTMYLAGFAAIAERASEERGIDYLGEDRDRASPGLPAMMETGSELSAVEYARANELRTEFRDALTALLGEYDLLALPTLAVTPPETDDPTVAEVDGESIDPHTDWLLTWPFNMTEHPAAALPAGFSDGLPVGLQLVGRRFADATVLAGSAAFERHRPWQDAYPPS